MHDIAESQQKLLYAKLESCHFYSVLMDNSTDKEHVENELFVILFCEKDDVLLELKTTARYYCVLEARKCDAHGLVECLGLALKGIGVDNLLLSESSWFSNSCRLWY